jgi:thiol-disulfide isomerase/thioredoxin
MLVLIPALAVGQDDVAKQAGSPSPKGAQAAVSGDTVQSINDDYTRELLQLEQRRLGRLARLAASQTPAEAAVTYEQLFRLAITGNLFREAEPAATAVVTSGSPSAVTLGLAHMVKIIAEADRGAFEQSLQSLELAVAERERAARSGAPQAVLPTNEIVEICDAYYQRLIHAAQFETARKAMQALLDHAQRPVIKEFLSRRLKRLDLVGKPAPPIQGTDIDGKPYRLADAQGKVVLVVFWASWCIPCAAEIESLQQVAASYGGKGLQIVGINLDVSQDGGSKLETVLPNIRHFVLDNNVTWPTLINGQGDKDYASAYGVTEIPANVLIGKDGTITQIDLVRKNLDPVIARAVQ